MAISRIQSKAANNGAGGTTISITLDNTPANGNFLVIGIATAGAVINEVSSISQTGATWAQVVQVANVAGVTSEIWAAPAVSGASTSITVNLATSLEAACVVVEYSNMLPSPNDQTASNTGDFATSSSVADSGTTSTTAQATELWFAYLASLKGLIVWTAQTNSFVEVAESRGSVVVDSVAEEKIVSSAGAANVGATHQPPQLTGAWAGVIATFKGSDFRQRVIMVS